MRLFLLDPLCETMNQGERLSNWKENNEISSTYNRKFIIINKSELEHEEHTSLAYLLFIFLTIYIIM
jgi:hypothetical protein